MLGPGIGEWAGRYCRTLLPAQDSHRESMWSDGLHGEAATRPLPHDELVRLQSRAQEARVSSDLGGQGDDLARTA